ncbi:hypothetical protein GTP58_27505 [Duganella sp. CY15W]|uniref:hypothetical protein n=1 Tax=Duganella sp. CY15W TaxID=2692172 RepID=UPI001369C09C|nr:hypothetical protein [Duganella sp. CY15W]MYM32084.1 hypothetical protein [Duganella sp. CY15W]
MEKTELLRVRVSPRLKADFEEICKTFGNEHPADMLREIVDSFVKLNLDRLGDRVVVHISKPEGYDPGAWRVFVKLRNPDEAIWMGSIVPFRFPQLDKRRLHSDDEYRAVVGLPDFSGYELGGVFFNGEWRGHLYSNGIEEDQNPTPIDQVKESLRSHITAHLDKFKSS